MAERKRKRGEQEGGGAGAAAGGGGGGAGEQQLEQQPVLRTYGQRQAKPDPVSDAAAPMLSEGLLKLIAGQPKRQKQRRQGGGRGE